jgi:hypothetical protein
LKPLNQFIATNFPNLNFFILKSINFVTIIQNTHR